MGAEPDLEDNWLESSTTDMERLSSLVQEDLVKPTASLADLMYESVEIHDSRHSLQLNTSLWRLSWIKFIFLPLTFMVGFFGTNVDVFSGDPHVRWYFVAAVLMMVLVSIVWVFTKTLDRHLINEVSTRIFFVICRQIIPIYGLDLDQVPQSCLKDSWTV